MFNRTTSRCYLAFAAMQLITAAFTPDVYSQLALPVSPNTATLGQYGQIPVSMYTGKPNIEIPLYNLTCGKLSVPISLSYYVDGFRPAKQAGWVGRDWALNAGGVITRVVKGRTDNEVENTTYNSYVRIVNELDPAVNNWPDDVDQGQGPYPPSPRDYEPDVFYFNFNGYSGKFLIGPAFTTTVQLYTSPYQDIKIITSLHLEEFKIITPDGTTYIFGGSAVTDVFVERADNYDVVAWYLKKIIAPNQTDVIDFLYAHKNPSNDPVAPDYEYKAHMFQLIKQTDASTYHFDNEVTLERWIQDGTCTSISADIVEAYTGRIFLSSITARSNQEDMTKITFTSLLAGDLPYLADEVNENFNWDYRNRKLDKIEVTDLQSGQLHKKFVFTYTDALTQRLTLKAVQEFGKTDADRIAPYIFEYNPIPDNLPYITKDVDHWGYYNHEGSYTGADNNSSILPSQVTLPDGSFTHGPEREPNANVAAVGMLTRINYPTGGYSKFDYEPNDYERLMQRKSTDLKTPEIVAAPSVKTLAGGVRIWKITSADGENAANDMVKEYKYIQNYSADPANPSPSSSGILGSGVQYYYSTRWDYNQAYTFNYKLEYANAHSFLPLISTQGNHIGYTEIAEVFSNGSFTVSKFTCFDSRIDKPAFKNENNGEYARYGAVNSMENERGKLLSVEMYTADIKLVSSKTYTYNSDPDRFNDHLWAVEQKRPIPSCNGDFNWLTVTGYEIYTYPYFVETETIREYDITDASNTRYAETVINYSYESSHHKMLTSKTTTDSRGSEVLTQYRYPPDFDATAGSNGSMGKLTDLHTISPVIEQLTWKDNKLIGGVITDYDKFTTNSVDYVLPKSVYVTQVALPVSGLDPDDVLNTDPASPVNPFINQLTNNIYDNDRLLQYTRENDLTVSYIWGYKNTRPIAEVKNAQANEILHASFEEEINTENFSTDSRTGKKSLKIAYAVSLPSPGTYRLTYWKKNTGSDWELVQEVISANTTIGGSAMVIDEVRLYPVEAQMTTYTYDRLMGVTSITDQANSTLNYEYDGLGRLQNIRDMDGNIVKNYFYHYGIK